MLPRNSDPYSLNLPCFEGEVLITSNNTNNARRIQNTESLLSELDTGCSSYSDTNNVRGSRRRSYKKSSKNRRRRFKKRPSVVMVNSDRVHEDNIPEETFSYADVPGELLFCHVCNIMVSTSQEFVTHLEDITHDDMMTCLQNEFEEEAEELRRKGKAKYERDFKDQGRDHVKKKSHCVMCDADIPESLSKHRRTEAHMTLRKYLHPECDLCLKNFKTRIEWTRHLLMPTHLMKVAASNIHRDTFQNFEYTAEEVEHDGNFDSDLVKKEEEVEEDKEEEVEEYEEEQEEEEEEQTEKNNIDSREQRNFYCKEDEEEEEEGNGHNIVCPKGEDSRVCSDINEVEEYEEEQEEEEEEQTEKNNADSSEQRNFYCKEDEEEEGNGHNIVCPEGEDSRVCSDINEYLDVEGDSRSSDHSVKANIESSVLKNEEGDQNNNLTTEYFIDGEGFQVPAYKNGRQWGKALLKQVTGHVCRGCKRFFDCDDLAKAHCESRAHYDVFISLMKRKILYESSCASKTSADIGRNSRKRMLSPREEESNRKCLKRL